MNQAGRASPLPLMQVHTDGKGTIKVGTELGLHYQLTPWIARDARDVGTGWRGTTEGEEHAI